MSIDDLPFDRYPTTRMTNSRSSLSNDLELDYSLSDKGMATVRFSNGVNTVESLVSDLHDSLLDLARLALSLQAGDRSTRAVFVVDPGELHLVVEIDHEVASYEVRRFDDWASLQPNKDWPHETLLDGVTATEALIEQVRGVLLRIQDNPGPEHYRALTERHDFPAQELERLEARIKLASGMELNVPILLARAFLVIAIAPPVYAIVYWLCSFVFSLYNLIWVPHIISLLFAAETGWVVWSRSRTLQTLAGRARAVALGAIVAGVAGFTGGFYGPLIYMPDSLQGPVLGALIAGSTGLILGGVSGLAFWRIRIGH